MQHPRLASSGAFALAASLLVARPVPAQQQPTFRSGVEIILVDVNVVDWSHKPVGDLQPAEFEVTVDGKTRKVLSAQFIRYDVNTTRSNEKDPVQTGATVASAPAPLAPSRNVLIVIDNDSMEPGDGILARQSAERFVQRLARDDRVGVATIPWLRTDITMTKNRDGVRKALAAVITASDRFHPAPFNFGLAEAFAVERGDGDLMNLVIGRECKAADRFCAEELKQVMRQMQRHAHLRGQRSLDGLRMVAESLRQLDGPKTMVLISGGAPTPDVRTAYDFRRIESAFAAAQVTLYTIFIRQSQLGQMKNRMSPTFADDERLEREPIEDATSVAGGVFMRSIGSFDQYLDGVATELSGSYLLGIEVQSSDRDGQPHRVQVKVNRRDLDVRARRQYVIERTGTPGGAAASPQAEVAVPARRPASNAAASESAGVDGATVGAALARVVDYVAAYRQQYSNVVAEEDYRQEAPGQRIHLRSDFLLVKTADVEGWVSFRDVYEVDGFAVRDRDNRLKTLFLDPAVGAMAQLRKIKEESARYNVGDVVRNVNVPLFPLVFLDPANVARFEFKMAGRREWKGLRVWELRFEERRTPTIVANMHASGWFLADTATGAVVQAGTYYTDALSHSADIVIEFARDASADIWAPAEMNEVYRDKTGSILASGTARYSNFRRFQVTTEEKTKVVK